MSAVKGRKPTISPLMTKAEQELIPLEAEETKWYSTHPTMRKIVQHKFLTTVPLRRCAGMGKNGTIFLEKIAWEGPPGVRTPYPFFFSARKGRLNFSGKKRN